MEILSTQPQLHIALFPFMSKGHTIPLLYLAKLILKHRPRATFTIFTTPGNKPFISSFLSSTSSNTFSINTLPFSTSNDDIPTGVESTDQLPSMSLFYPFTKATEQLKTHFETALESIQKGPNPIRFSICDGFLYWTHEPASRFNIPRFTFYGMNNYTRAISEAMFVNNNPLAGANSDDELVQVPDFPWIKISKNHFDDHFKNFHVKSLTTEFLMNCAFASSKSDGFFVNSFEELEKPFFEYSNSKSRPNSYCVGPFCLADEKPNIGEFKNDHSLIKWLDEKKKQGKRVLYIAFGSQAEISNEQLKEIVKGLEKSQVEFIWALRIKPWQEEVMEGFESRVKERGMVVRGWVEQREILEHESVEGFLSHCGWNSVTESICAGVPIIAWPMMAEQPLNAKMVVEEIKVGLRIETCDGTIRGFVKGDDLSKMVHELMHGEVGEVVRKKVNEVSVGARRAVEEGGSSWRNLEFLLIELEGSQTTRNS